MSVKCQKSIKNYCEKDMECSKNLCKIVRDLKIASESICEEIRYEASEKLKELAEMYYTKGFKRDEVFQIENTIELRNGERYIIKKGIKDEVIWNMAFKVREDNCIEIGKSGKISALWNGYGFYGFYTDYDVVKVYNENGEMIAERTQYDVLSGNDYSAC